MSFGYIKLLVSYVNTSNKYIGPYTDTDKIYISICSTVKVKNSTSFKMPGDKGPESVKVRENLQID